MAQSGLITGLLAAALWLSPSASLAQDEEAPPPDVGCPEGPISSAVSGNLAPEWRRPPVAGELSSTSVLNESGKLALVCTYDAVGAIAQPMPDRYQSCVPVENGFTCVRRTRESAFVSRGRITLSPGRGADLDNGDIVERMRESDIAFAGFAGLVGNAGPSALLESFNETQFGQPPNGSTRPADCRRAEFGGTRVTVGADVARGKPVCYRTNENRVGMLNLEKVDGFTVRLRHRTLR